MSLGAMMAGRASGPTFQRQWDITLDATRVATNPFPNTVANGVIYVSGFGLIGQDTGGNGIVSWTDGNGNSIYAGGVGAPGWMHRVPIYTNNNLIALVLTVDTGSAEVVATVNGVDTTIVFFEGGTPLSGFTSDGSGASGGSVDVYAWDGNTRLLRRANRGLGSTGVGGNGSTLSITDPQDPFGVRGFVAGGGGGGGGRIVGPAARAPSAGGASGGFPGQAAFSNKGGSGSSNRTVFTTENPPTGTGFWWERTQGFGFLRVEWNNT